VFRRFPAPRWRVCPLRLGSPPSVSWFPPVSFCKTAASSHERRKATGNGFPVAHTTHLLNSPALQLNPIELPGRPAGVTW